MKRSATEPREPSSAASRPRPRPRASCLGAAALLAALVYSLALALTGPAWGQTGAGSGLPRVGSVKVEGTRALKAKEIKKVLKTHTKSSLAFWSKSPLYRQDFLRADIEIIRQFAAQHGYLDAHVSGLAEPDKDPAKNEVHVVYQIVEGPRADVDSVAVTGVHVLKQAELDKAISTKVGQPFNPLKLTADKRSLAEVYSDKGYFPVLNASWTHPESTKVRVHFDVKEGPSYRVGAISVEGVKTVDTVVVTRELLLHSGEPFARDLLQRSNERLYETRLFQIADFKPTKVDTDSAVVSFAVRVRERKHKNVEGGVGVGSADGVRLLGAWEHTNLWHKNHRLRLESSYAFGGLHRFHNSITYTDPWLLGLRLQGSLGPYFDQSEEQFRDQPFTQRRWGVGFVVKRDLSRFARATAGIDQQWSDAITTPTFTDPADLAGFDSTQFVTTRVTLTWTYDDRDDVFDPHKGELYQMAGDLAGKLLGGEGQFLKGTASAARYLPIRRSTTLAARFEIGGIAPYGGTAAALSQVPITDLYKTGGATTVRGYAEEQIIGADQTGGLMILLTNIEVRWSMSRVFGAALFLDGGNVWSRPRDFKWNDLGPGGVADGNDYRYAAGLGLRIRTPVGPVRFDSGYRLRESEDRDGLQKEGWRFHFSLGQAY